MSLLVLKSFRWPWDHHRSSGGSKDTLVSAIRLCGMSVPPSGAS